MESKHTPGPWTLIHEPDLTAITAFRIDGSSEIAALPNLSASDEANAKLMAAAPELLEALERIADWCEDAYTDHYGGPCGCKWQGKPCAYCQVKSAIAKAKGE